MSRTNASMAIAHAQRAFAFLLDLLYPPCCGGCDKHGEGWWCAACDAQTPWLSGDESRTMLTLPTGESLTVISAAQFASPLREGIHRFKYESQPQLAEAFAARMRAIWDAGDRSAEAADVIVPVPLHASRLRERGFNQSLLLARHIGERAGIPTTPQALQRVRATQQQAQLDAQGRQANVRGAFVARSELVTGKAIALVDDVFTTGATLMECASVLYQSGARRVIALTLARA